jgi:predicted small lipoprotein YifL
MKRILSSLLVAVALGGWIGCGTRGSVDTSKMEKSFQGAASQTDVSTAVTAIKGGDYAKAVPVLQKVIKAGGLTDEQKDAISTAITGMQIVASQNPNKYSVEVYQSLSDLVAYLDGREPARRPVP